MGWKTMNILESAIVVVFSAKINDPKHGKIPRRKIENITVSHGQSYMEQEASHGWSVYFSMGDS